MVSQCAAVPTRLCLHVGFTKVKLHGQPLNTSTFSFDVTSHTYSHVILAVCCYLCSQYPKRTHLIILLGKLRRAAVGAQLMVQLVGARLDGHARAVEALRKEHPLAAQPVVCARELQLRGKHLCVRKGG